MGSGGLGILISVAAAVNLVTGHPAFGSGLLGSAAGFNFHSITDTKSNPYAELDGSLNVSVEHSLAVLSVRLTNSELATYAMDHTSFGSNGWLVVIMLSGVAIATAALASLRGSQLAYYSALGLLFLGYLPTLWSLYQIFPTEMFFVLGCSFRAVLLFLFVRLGQSLPQRG